MRILNVEAIEVQVPLNKPASFSVRSLSARELTIVKVTTEDDVVGIGTVYMHVGSIVQRKLRPLVIGDDIFSIEQIWDKMYREMYRDRKGAAIRAISAVDIALWDAVAKTVKLPLYKLLGGGREKVPCYSSGGYYREGDPVENIVDEMSRNVKKGFKAVKMKIGRLHWKKDLERVRAARETIGEDVDLMLDANNAYDTFTAIKAGRAYEKFDIYWYEEPVWPDNIQGSAEVARVLDTPIASGELEYTRFGFRDLLENHAVDIIQPDVGVL